MRTADTYVEARIDTETKKRAAEALQAMGLSISDAICLLLLRIADERRFPFEVKAPDATRASTESEEVDFLENLPGFMQKGNFLGEE